MESTYQLATALACAAGLLALFALLRQAFRAPSAPSWMTSTIVACTCAVALTLGFAGSLFYLASALQLVVPGLIAFAGMFVLHLGMVAVLLKALSADESESVEQAKPQDGLSAGAVAS